MNVVGVLLAAGTSARFGGPRPKQVVDFAGQPLVRRVAERALASRLHEVVLVLGYEAEEVAAAVEGLDLRRVYNPRFAEGQGTSIRAGVEAIDPSADAALFIPCDQPFLTTGTLDRLIEAWRSSDASIVVPVSRGQRGAPVLFERVHFAELSGLRGDRGGRALLARHEARVQQVDIPDARELRDVDTKEDLRELLSSLAINTRSDERP